MATQISGDTGVSQCQPGSVSQDDLAANVVGKGPCFRGYVTAASHPNDSSINPNLAQDFDIGGDFLTPAVAKYQPTVAGYYQINASISFANLCVNGYILIKKNGTGNNLGASQGNFYQGQAAALVYLNGSTDYVQIFTYQSSGAAMLCDVEFTGFLARAA